jgi:choline dehydrogenase-like flavoprotein
VIQNARGLSDRPAVQATLCVVGAGVAGILLALELEREGHDVLLLEAGNGSRDRRQRAAQAGNVSGGQHEPFEDVSLRRLGGAMALWGGRLLPLDAADFARHAARDERWPFGYEALEPFYRIANERLDAGAFEYDAGEAMPDEQPLFSEMTHSEDVTQNKTWRWCPPLRFSHFRRRLAASKRIRLLYNALVTELRLDASGTRVVSARVATSPGRRFEVRAATFVLAGGGLETARLLLASHAQRSEGIGNAHGHVGRHYMTHPVAEVGALSVEAPRAARLCSFSRSRDGVYARPLLAISERARANHGLLNLNLTFWSPDPHDPSHGSGLLSAYALAKRFLVGSGLTGKVAGAHRSNLARDPALLRHLSNVVRTMPETGRRLAGWSQARWLSKRSIPALISVGRAGAVRLRIDAEQRDDPANFVTLSGERDAFGMPRLHLRYRVSERDRHSYYSSIELVAAELLRCSIGRLALPSRESFVAEAALGDGTHQMGLTRMAARAADGVVDVNGRVHDCPNLFIASSAVFPTGGAAPPTLTLAALCMRMARNLDRELRSS